MPQLSKCLKFEIGGGGVRLTKGFVYKPGGVRYGSHTPIFKARSSHDQNYDGRKEC